MRFGLFGTGFWAAEVHAAALDADDDVELVGVWGRDPAKAAAVAERYGARAYDDVARLLGDVEAVDVALPPDVQAGIAVQAAAAGRHLLLDKPLALTGAQADEVVRAADATGVASSVFFTSRFVPSVARWIDDTSGRPWHGASATWLGSIFSGGNPFGASPWRREKGGLWDVGPHALSVTLPLLGPVARVASATRDADGTVHVVLLHEAGGSSVLTLGLDVPAAAATSRCTAYGEDGWTTMPERDVEAEEALGIALRGLLADAAAGRSASPCDVRFGAKVVHVLEQAQALLDA